MESGLWTDDLYMKDVCTGKRMKSSSFLEEEEEEEEDRMSILCWNILAESFLTRRSHPGLSMESQTIVFNFEKRLKLLVHQLTHFITTTKFDILCLQEVDLRPQFETHVFQPLGYQSIHATRPTTTTTTTTTTSSSSTTMNGCMIAFHTTKYKLLDSKVIHFDNLTQSSSSSSISNDDDPSKRSSSSSLCGMIASYNRRNTGLLVLLQHKKSGSIVCIANAHLYWNPGYEYVKLSQCKYLIHCAQIFATNHKNKQQQQQQQQQQRHPIIICGDFNSKPTSIVYQFLTQSIVDARMVAPWYHYYFTQQQQQQQQQHDVISNGIVRKEFKSSPSILSKNKDENNNISNNENTLGMETIDLNHNKNDNDIPNNNHDGIEIRYLLDYTLNRFTRWLRILGIDAALETKEEEYQRTRHGNM